MTFIELLGGLNAKALYRVPVAMQSGADPQWILFLF